MDTLCCKEGFAGGVYVLPPLPYDVSDYEPVESGLIKSLAKTLLLGGLVKLTSKMLKNEVTK